MTSKPLVLLGDIVSSSKLIDRAIFQLKLEDVCSKINRTFHDDIHADLKILKGADEIGGVLLHRSNINKIFKILQFGLFPNRLRIVVVRGTIDTSYDSRDVSLMDGPAFHRASDLMNDLKNSNLLFSMDTGEQDLDTCLSNQINLIEMLREQWSQRQFEIMKRYERTLSQKDVCEELGVSQQYVSKVLRSIRWKEINNIEKNIDRLLS